MKKIIIIFGLVIAGSAMIPAGDSGGPRLSNPLSLKDSRNFVSSMAAPDYGRIPLYFIPNRGQVDERALFYAKTQSYTLWMTKQGLVFDSARSYKKEGERKGAKFKILQSDTPLSDLDYERDTSRIMFLDASPSPEIVALEPTEHRVNYFLGGNPDMWRTNIQTSKAVLYKEIYSRIDLKIYGVEKQLEYDWLVKPGGAVEDIRFAYQNAQKTQVDGDGNLIARTRFGELIHKKPLSYQEINEEKVSVQAKFRRIENDTYGFDIESYDRSYPLTIDPVVLVYSTYLGGSDRDQSYDIAVDNLGSAYVVGTTVSPDFPVKNAYDSTWNTNVDIFITKFSPAGNALVYSTYLGGNGSDSGSSIAVDSSGSAYVTGITYYSSDFPVQNAYDPTWNGANDAFVTKLSPAGNTLAYSTFLGGTGNDSGAGIAVDSFGAAYVTGRTISSDFPVFNAYDSTANGGDDVFIAKFTPAGNSLAYSTFLGGSEWDVGANIAVDAGGAAYVTGTTYSANFPLQNAFDSSIGGGYLWSGYYVYDAFVTKIDSTGHTLVFSTFLGGAGSDYGNAIAVDGAGSVYVTGSTDSSDFPVANAYDPTWNGHYVGHGIYTSDAFVTKFTASGNALIYSTHLGGAESSNDGNDIAVDSAGAAFVAGDTASSDFPVLNGLNLALGDGWNVFVTKFHPGGNTLGFSTLLGGTHDETGAHIALDSAGSVYITGNTSSDFPLRNAFSSTPNNIFVTKLSFIALYPPANLLIQRLVNNFIFYKEYLNSLTWAANSLNQAAIVKYKIYRKVKGAADSTYQWLADVSASGSSLRYDDRALKKSVLYSYRISAVDDSGNESGYAEVSNN